MLRRPPFAAVLVCLAAASAFTPLRAEDDWCASVAGGPSGRKELPLDLSAAHAAVRFFGTAAATATSDLALAAALNPPDALDRDGRSALQAYSEQLADVCLIATDNRTLGPVKVDRVGGVALIRPGTGPVLLPAGTLAVAIDLRHLPNTVGLRAALEAAVAPALAQPVPRAARRVRAHEGLPTEIQLPYYEVYYDEIEEEQQPPILAGGHASMPIALLTGGPMAPEAVEFAMTLRQAGRAFVIGADLLAAIAESRWQGVGVRDAAFATRDAENLPGRRRVLGKWGLAYRTADLVSDGTRWPDRIPADITTADPEGVVANLPAMGNPAPIAAGQALRPALVTRSPGVQGEPPQGALGDARAALLTLHGTALLFYPALDDLWDSQEAGRAALDARLVALLADLGTAPPATKEDLVRRLRRFTEAMQDAGARAASFPFVTASAALPLVVDEIGGEPVVLRSAIPEILPGDAIESVGGRTAAACYENEEALVSAPTDRLRFFLATQGAILEQSAPVQVIVRDPSGDRRSFEVAPQPPGVLSGLGRSTSHRPSGRLTEFGAPDLHYLNLGIDLFHDYGALFSQIRATRDAAGLIVDLRDAVFDSYTTATSLICEDFKSPVFEIPIVGDGLDETVMVEQYSLPSQYYPAEARFCGPIVLLINTRTLGSGETAATMLQDARRARIVGSPSAGASANNALILLPGGTYASMSGLVSKHADGGRFLGVGILPDVTVEPQAADYASGFDRVLDAGIREMRALLASPCPLDPDQDIDHDGACGDVDNCRDRPNPGQADTDHDGRGDACDPCPNDAQDDADADHVCADRDNCPALANPGQENADGDVFGDACDLCPTVASDDGRDTDLDGLGDACDRCPSDPRNDVDGDGLCGDADNCPLVPNPGQVDADADGSGDVCDVCPHDPSDDFDADQVCGDVDNCPQARNPGQEDADGDGFGDVCDNCPHAANPGQEDLGGDGAGDACQPAVSIHSVREDGGTELEVSASARDPQGEPIHGVIRVLDASDSFVLPDFMADPDCGAPLAPEGLAGRGVVFARIGSAEYLVDADFLSGQLLPAVCGDGMPDYVIAIGRCGMTPSPPDVFVDLGAAGEGVPGPVCITRADGTAAFDLLLERLGTGWRLQGATPPAVETTYAGTGLPAQIPLQGLTSGRTYRLEISATDGVTPEVRASREFLYQGESVMRFTASVPVRPRPGLSG